MSRIILCSCILTLVLAFVICQKDRKCDPGFECIPNSDCDSYQEKRNKLDTLERKTQEFNDLLSEESKKKLHLLWNAVKQDLTFFKVKHNHWEGKEKGCIQSAKNSQKE